MRRIRRLESIVHGTADAAWASWADGRLGVLRPGALADVIVLDRDPLSLDPESLLDARVVLTISGGRILLDRR